MPIRSALTLPIETGGVIGHLIVLNTVHQEREWPDVFVTRLRMLGEMLVAALERERALAAHRASESRLAAGADLAGLGFYEVDFGKGVTYADDRFRDLCGVPAERAQGLQVLEFWMEHLHPDDRPRVMELRQRLHDGRLDRLSVEYRFVHPARGETLDPAPGWRRQRATPPAAPSARSASSATSRSPGESRKPMHDLSRRLIRAHEDERALLARELHDDLTQRLAVLAIDVGRAELAASDGAQSDTMRAVREGLVRLSEDVHSLAYQLHPSVLEELGLADALRAECERLARRSRVDLSLKLDPLPDAVGKDAALCLFRVAQESLNNVIRHASARSATLTLRSLDGGLLLGVRDDGVGFDPAGPRKGRNLGLASMRERVRLVNGTLDVESAPGQGTAIVVWVPTEGGAR